MVVLYTEGFDRFVTSTATPIATGWRGSCRVGLSPTERAHVFTAHGAIMLLLWIQCQFDTGSGETSSDSC
jgi:hypothetical protein